MLGKYQLIKKLATGGMAEVFLARADGPMGFAKMCVVKRILPHFNDDPRFIEMFLSEARLAAQMNHPNLVQIFDFGQADGQYFLAMEFIDGPNLRTLNQAARSFFGPIDFALCARIIALAAEGLHYAHQLKDETGAPLGLVHRDISPDNILVGRQGSVKVVDFGIAKASNQPHLTKSGMIKGKMAYMPPEQLAREPLDQRADIFALGIVLYELVTGGLPFDATSEVSIIQALMNQQPLERPTAFRPDCPPALEQIILTCLDKNRERRFATCSDLQAALEQFVASTGRAVGSRDIAALVETVHSNSDDVTQTNARAAASDALADPGLDKTSLTNGSHTPSQTPLEPSSTADRDVPVAATKRSPARVGAAVAVALLVVGGLAAFFLRVPPPPVTVTGAPTVVDAGAPSFDAGTPPAASPDAATALVVEPDQDAGSDEATEVDAGSEEPDLPTHKAPTIRNGRLELRVRPYATVYLDDKKLGDTPLPAQLVPVGKHRLRLVNEKLGKDVLLEVTIKPGDNVIKHNLKE